MPDREARSAAVIDYDSALLQREGIDPQGIRCNRDNRWGNTLQRDAKAGAADMVAVLDPMLTQQADREELRKRLQSLLFWRMVRGVLLEANTNNLGFFPLRGRTYTGPDGRPHQVLVFRTGMTPAPDAPESCFGSLLGAAGVRHVVNLFDGDIPAQDLTAAEAAAAAGRGATYHNPSDDPQGYGPWRDQLRKHYDDPAQRQQATLGVARLIREQVLLPDGRAPRGNIHIHCGGGMHRTGMIAGVIERCVNGEQWDVVRGHYLYHVGYRDQAHPGGMEEGNLRFIREFDCALLDREAPQAPR